MCTAQARGGGGGGGQNMGKISSVLGEGGLAVFLLAVE